MVEKRVHVPPLAATAVNELPVIFFVGDILRIESLNLKTTDSPPEAVPRTDTLNLYFALALTRGIVYGDMDVEFPTLGAWRCREVRPSTESLNSALK